MINSVSGLYLLAMLASIALTHKMHGFGRVVPWTLAGFAVCAVAMLALLVRGNSETDPGLLFRLGVIAVSLGHVVAVLIASKVERRTTAKGNDL